MLPTNHAGILPQKRKPFHEPPFSPFRAQFGRARSPLRPAPCHLTSQVIRRQSSVVNKLSSTDSVSFLSSSACIHPEPSILPQQRKSCSPSPEGEGRDAGGCPCQRQSLLKQYHVGHLPHFPISLLISAFSFSCQLVLIISASQRFSFSVIFFWFQRFDLCLSHRTQDKWFIGKVCS